MDRLRETGSVNAPQLVRCLRELTASVYGQPGVDCCSDPYCLAPILAKASALPHAPADMEERIRDILTIWAGKILDHAHRDYYELVRFYYRKRVEAFLAHAEANLAARRAIVDEKRLAPVYHQIEQSSVRQPFVVGPQDRYAGGPAKAAAEILARHRITAEEASQLASETFGPGSVKSRGK